MKYIAYGSNLNLKQMAKRCPSAKVVGITMLENYELTFRNVATIEPKFGELTPVAIWEIDKPSEQALDRYEGFPHLYRKEYMQVKCKGKQEKCLVYIMNTGKANLPNMYYFNTIREGYMDVGLDESFLIKAIENTEMKMNSNN